MSQAQFKQKEDHILNISKVPPQNIEAEQAILASILIDNHALNACLEHITSNDFYKEAHKVIFLAMMELSEKNEPTDLVTLNAHLEKMGLINKVGGSTYLSHIVDTIPTAANVSSYAKLVREKSILRQLIDAGTDIVRDCYSTEHDVNETLDLAESKVFSISEKRTQKGFASLKDLVKSGYKKLEELYENKSDITGLATGFRELDKLTAGLQRSDLIIVAGRPSMGKTAFALNVVENACHKSNAKIAVFSMEMSQESLVMRMLTSQARIDSMRVRTGDLAESDWPRLLSAADKLAHMKVYIDDQPAQTTMDIRAKSRRLAQETGGLDLIMIDYLQLMRSSGKFQSREQEISDITRSLKSLAKELSVPVVALSQLNRSLEGRNNKRPMMSDLRESGAIEQDADIIAFIYRDVVYNPDTPEKNTAEVIVGKQRNGSTGVCRLAFLSQYVRFEDLAFDSEFKYEPQSEPAVMMGTDGLEPEDVIY
ncbi:MAG: replicative DNA helicase [Deltaproteobacteria bacterium]|nr:replicative DNA helicase [Deltaproteobacteria bacterium]